MGYLQFKRILVVLALIISLTGFTGSYAMCSSDNSVEGVWQTEGYGMIFEFAGGKVTAYGITSISGTKTFEGTYSDDNTMQIRILGSDASYDFNFSIENGKLILHNPYYDVYYCARKLEALPKTCQNGGTPFTDDSEFNFEIFWRTFKEQYAFFQLRGVNWDNQYRVYRSQVTKYTTPQQLFEILCQMVEPLRDAHVSLTGLGQYYSTGVDDAIYVQAFELLQAQIQARKAVAVDANGFLSYQELENNIGLITPLFMQDYSTTQDLTADAQAINEVINALINKKAIIIDLRYNMGGSDTIARIWASRFADCKRFVFSKQARNGNHFTQLMDFYVEPQGLNQYHGKVIILISTNTVSAGEILTMCMKELPNVTVIGEHTNGVHSNTLIRKLPNDWSFTLSNERYFAADQQVYEKIGLQPDVYIPFDFDEIMSGKDRIMEAALEYAQR
jgi:carboxyl-terminal processing protease